MNVLQAEIKYKKLELLRARLRRPQTRISHEEQSLNLHHRGVQLSEKHLNYALRQALNAEKSAARQEREVVALENIAELLLSVVRHDPR